MTIEPGQRVGPYEILAPIGAGGMGEVYRARDPKLGRDLAIKVLPDALASDADRIARFQREAKVLASLDHPNIASIYGLEDSGGAQALVMQLVEGPTLADRIKAGPIPADESVRIAKQIADALEYAHERGIIHRDLKPANVKVTNDDTVKVLDFGLAKALEGDASSIDISRSPTISRMATMQGVLLGTAAYMSPEQAKAKSVDRRADIWAFGCVLYEMLTGRQAFTGETVTDTLASIIKEEPDWKLLPSATPIRVRVLLQRCLQKDPKQRLRDIGDGRISLDEVLSGATEIAPATEAASVAPAWQRAIPWALLGVMTVAFGAVALIHFSEKPSAPSPIRFEIPLPEKTTLVAATSFALSPDGSHLAFAATGPDGALRIWVRSLDSLDARPLSGTESRDLIAPVFWSPDSRFIAFDAVGRLKKVPVSGGPAETICDLNPGMVAVGGSWNWQGVIIFGQNGGSLMQVSAAGGTASPVTVVNRSHGEYHHVFPWFLPDGRHFVYSRQGSTEVNGIYVGSLDTKPEEQSPKRLLASESATVAYVPSTDGELGRLLYGRDRALMTQPFDLGRLQLEGESVTLAENIASFLDGAAFHASSNGILAYRSGEGGALQPTWYDRQGKILGQTSAPAANFVQVKLSPDGKWAAGTGVGSAAQKALWLFDFSRGTSTRFTFGSTNAADPIWSPDGKRIIFASDREGHFDLYQKPVNGATDEELLLKSDEDKYPTSWSRDGRFLLYMAYDPKTKQDLWVLPLEADKKPFPFLRTEFNEAGGQFSPDDRWVTYESDESGQPQIYVRPFSPNARGIAAASAGKWLISNGDGANPHWRADGKELYYNGLGAAIMAVEVSTSPSLQAGVPKLLFPAEILNPFLTGTWDVAPDGQRFLFTAPTAQAAQAPFTVVLNWQAALKK